MGSKHDLEDDVACSDRIVVTSSKSAPGEREIAWLRLVLGSAGLAVAASKHRAILIRVAGGHHRTVMAIDKAAAYCMLNRTALNAFASTAALS